MVAVYLPGEVALAKYVKWIGKCKIGIREVSFKRSLQWGVLVMKVGIKAQSRGWFKGMSTIPKR